MQRPPHNPSFRLSDRLKRDLEWFSLAVQNSAESGRHSRTAHRNLKTTKGFRSFLAHEAQEVRFVPRVCLPGE